MNPLRISFIGAGRVAGALCRRLYNKGCKIENIVSRSPGYGPDLAAECNASWFVKKDFGADSDLIIVSVQDKYLIEVLGNIRCSNPAIVAHTAGSYGLEVFPSTIEHKAVLYPLQTFSHGRETDFLNLPFFIEGSDEDSIRMMEQIVNITGGNPIRSNADERRKLHLAAVFACNFTNHMLTLSKKMANEAGVDFSLLEHLIRETVNKALEIGPENSQTGPAVRNDQVTIDRHLDLLGSNDAARELYLLITQSITKQYYTNSDDKL